MYIINLENCNTVEDDVKADTKADEKYDIRVDGTEDCNGAYPQGCGVSGENSAGACPNVGAEPEKSERTSVSKPACSPT